MTQHLRKRRTPSSCRLLPLSQRPRHAQLTVGVRARALVTWAPSSRSSKASAPQAWRALAHRLCSAARTVVAMAAAGARTLRRSAHAGRLLTLRLCCVQVVVRRRAKSYAPAAGRCCSIRRYTWALRGALHLRKGAMLGRASHSRLVPSCPGGVQRALCTGAC